MLKEAKLTTIEIENLTGIDNFPVPAFAVGFGGGLMSSNRRGKAFLHMLKRSPSIAHEIDREIKTVLSIGQESTHICDINSRIFSLAITPLDNGLGVMITVHDITQMHSAYEQVKSELENRISELESYASMVAHDIKNPLTIAVGYASLIESDDGRFSDKSIREFAGKIIASTKDAENIINEILTMVRIEKNITDMELDVCSVQRILSNAMIKLDQEIQKSKTTVELATDFPIIFANNVLIEQVWINLITNAIKYGGQPPHIKIGSITDPEYVSFWIEDNGNGVPEEKANDIFENGYRLKKHMQADGHGIGLGIVKKIIALHGGNICVEKSAEGGARFVFKLPRKSLTEKEA